MFGLGFTELMIILVIVLLLFGVGRISGLMKDLGKGVTAFKEGLNEHKPTAPISAARVVKAVAKTSPKKAVRTSAKAKSAAKPKAKAATRKRR